MAQRAVRISEQFADAGIWQLEEMLAFSNEGPLWDLASHFSEELAEQ